jgi:hypothetical protein
MTPPATPAITKFAPKFITWLEARTARLLLYVRLATFTMPTRWNTNVIKRLPRDYDPLHASNRVAFHEMFSCRACPSRNQLEECYHVLFYCPAINDKRGLLIDRLRESSRNLPPSCMNLLQRLELNVPSPHWKTELDFVHWLIADEQMDCLETETLLRFDLIDILSSLWTKWRAQVPRLTKTERLHHNDKTFVFWTIMRINRSQQRSLQSFSTQWALQQQATLESIPPYD